MKYLVTVKDLSDRAEPSMILYAQTVETLDLVALIGVVNKESMKRPRKPRRPRYLDAPEQFPEPIPKNE